MWNAVLIEVTYLLLCVSLRDKLTEVDVNITVKALTMGLVRQDGDVRHKGELRPETYMKRCNGQGTYYEP